VTVEVDLSGIKRLARQIDFGHPTLDKGWKQAAYVFRSFTQRRFSNFSRGGGNWAPLAESTIKGRRKGKGSRKFKKGSVAILIDTGLLFGGVQPAFVNAPGQFEQLRRFGIEVGYGGPGRYPEGDATVTDIAHFHQTGAGRLPKREIIVEPDAHTFRQMVGRLQLAVNKLTREAN
jgi:hypothetical protein